MCSYCGCDSIEVIGRFMAEHVEIINANGVLRAAVRSGDPEALEVGRSALADLLWPHTVAEEAGLFQVLARDEEYASHIATLCAEHATLAVHLAEITPGDLAAMEKFEIELREHINKEDNGLFPAAAIALDGPQWVEVHQSTPPARDAADAHPHDHTHPADHAHPHDHTHPHATDHTHETAGGSAQLSALGG